MMLHVFLWLALSIDAYRKFEMALIIILNPQINMNQSFSFGNNHMGFFFNSSSLLPLSLVLLTLDFTWARSLLGLGIDPMLLLSRTSLSCECFPTTRVRLVPCLMPISSHFDHKVNFLSTPFLGFLSQCWDWIIILLQGHISMNSRLLLVYRFLFVHW